MDGCCSSSSPGALWILDPIFGLNYFAVIVLLFQLIPFGPDALATVKAVRGWVEVDENHHS